MALPEWMATIRVTRPGMVFARGRPQSRNSQNANSYQAGPFQIWTYEKRPTRWYFHYGESPVGHTDTFRQARWFCTRWLIRELLKDVESDEVAAILRGVIGPGDWTPYLVLADLLADMDLDAESMALRRVIPVGSPKRRRARV